MASKFGTWRQKIKQYWEAIAVVAVVAIVLVVLKFGTWRQKIKQYWGAIVVVAIVLVVVIVLIIVGYRLDWTGFNSYTIVTTSKTIGGVAPPTKTTTTVYQPGKTLWDWLQLLAALAIPVVVGIGAAVFTMKQGQASVEANKQQRATELQIATDNQREIALQAYIDKMSELLLEKKLRKSSEDAEVRKIARIRTLTVLLHVDGVRKRRVLQFLYESGLVEKEKSIISLDGADLRGADLREVNLNKTNLFGTHLSEAFIDVKPTALSEFLGRFVGAILAGQPKVYQDEGTRSGDDLGGVALSGANLKKADLSGANLGGADLSRANLDGADLSQAYLSQANLSGASLIEADLHRADLYGANLKGANVTQEKLNTAKSLEGATMPDGSKHS